MVLKDRWHPPAVNNGAARKAVITDIPEEVKSFSIYVTDKEKGMEKTGEVTVKDGTVEVELLPTAFVSLMNGDKATR
jgi:hypothetical protein